MLHIAATPKLTTSIKYVLVTTKKTDILADGETYKEARTVRTAKFSASQSTADNVETYKIGDFVKLTSNSTLAEKVNNMPSIVLQYLSDTLASKLDRLTLTNATQAQIDGLKNACVVNCIDSVAVLGFKNYCLTVKCVGSGVVEQVLTTTEGAEYYRAYNAATKKWSGWSVISDSMHIEVKSVGSTLYVRHGVLPVDAKSSYCAKRSEAAGAEQAGTSPTPRTKERGRDGKRSCNMSTLRVSYCQRANLVNGMYPNVWT